MKKILFVYPHNFLELNMGTNIRVYALAKELHAMGYGIDLLALTNFMSVFDHFDEMNEKEKLVDRLYLCDYKKIKAWKKRGERLRKCFRPFFRRQLDDWASPHLKRLFARVVAAADYTHIVMFYAYTANLLSFGEGKRNVKTIYFMEDLLSVGEYVQKRSPLVGELLDCELKRLEHFGSIACISYDEKILVEKLLGGNRQFYFLPHIIEHVPMPVCEKGQKLRVTFVGYDNPYNVEGVRWFLNEVCPLLGDDVELTLVGKVNRHIVCNRPNVTQIDYAASLDEIYCRTDVVICPLLNGTGMKIKVIEAMSRGIPVVCTSRGVDGFPDKTCNGCLVADTPADFASYLTRLAHSAEFYNLCRERVVDYFGHVLCWKQHKNTLYRLFQVS